MWTDLGGPPSAGELEVTVIGPGHGESVVVHLGQGEWIVVDSCIDSSEPQAKSAPLRYLEEIGVVPSVAVKLVIVSHWDDDHVRGISELLKACPSAIFCCSTVLAQQEFTEFVEAVASSGAATGQGNVSEFKKVLAYLGETKQQMRIATPGRQLLDSSIAKVRSWSPNDLENQKFLSYVAQNFPKAWTFGRRMVAPSRNLTSVVLTVEVGETSILLGADMEATGSDESGWGAIVAEGRRNGMEKSQIVKIPHHGSSGSHDERMWGELLVSKPISVVAPFGRGKLQSRPPKTTDVRRISGLSSAVFLTAPHRSRVLAKKDVAVERTLREQGINLHSGRVALGMVRLRKSDTGDWCHELFGPARAAKS